jgi:hypothetical protein
VSENPRDLDAARAADDDVRWTERLDAVWRPEPLDAAGRARFDARLRERLDGAADRRRRSPLRWLAPVATAAAVALAVWGGARTPTQDGPLADGGVSLADGGVTDWEWDLLLGGALAEDDAAALPEEYDAIASVFLE